jgi:hypothetical protein
VGGNQSYADGVVCNGCQKYAWGEYDYQFPILRSDVRWNPTAERAIHIWPTVQFHFAINCFYYHHRTLKKIVSRTKDWDTIQPNMKKECNEYAYNVEQEIKKYVGKDIPVVVEPVGKGS